MPITNERLTNEQIKHLMESLLGARNDPAYMNGDDYLNAIESLSELLQYRQSVPALIGAGEAMDNKLASLFNDIKFKGVEWLVQAWRSAIAGLPVSHNAPGGTNDLPI